MKWILILLVMDTSGRLAAGGGPAVAAFDDRPACQTAAEKVKDTFEFVGGPRVGTLCVPAASQ